jgi:uncharacterized protein YggE
VGCQYGDHRRLTNSDNAKGAPISYSFFRHIDARVNNLQQYAQIIDTVSKLPFVSIGNISFDMLNSDNIDDSLLIEASKKARAKADRLAASMSCKVVDVQAISELPIGDVWSHFSMESRDYHVGAIMAAPQSTFSPPNTIRKSKIIYVMFRIAGIR